MTHTWSMTDNIYSFLSLTIFIIPSEYPHVAVRYTKKLGFSPTNYKGYLCIEFCGNEI